MVNATAFGLSLSTWGNMGLAAVSRAVRRAVLVASNFWARYRTLKSGGPLSTPAERYRELSSPKHSLLRHVSLHGRESTRVSQRFSQHRNKWVFSAKLFFGSIFIRPEMPISLLTLRWGRLRALHRSLQAKLDALLDNTKFYELKAWPPVIGWASSTGLRSNSFILGLEGWVACIPLLASSAAGHELMHCAQHIIYGVFDMEWSTGTAEEPSNARGRAIGWEVHASIAGGPLAFASLIFMLFWALLLL